MARIFERKPTPLDRALRPLERTIYQFAGVPEDDEVDWKAYAVALALFKVSRDGLAGPCTCAGSFC